MYQSLSLAKLALKKNFWCHIYFSWHFTRVNLSLSWIVSIICWWWCLWSGHISFYSNLSHLLLRMPYDLSTLHIGWPQLSMGVGKPSKSTLKTSILYHICRDCALCRSQSENHECITSLDGVEGTQWVRTLFTAPSAGPQGKLLKNDVLCSF